MQWIVVERTPESPIPHATIIGPFASLESAKSWIKSIKGREYKTHEARSLTSPEDAVKPFPKRAEASF